MFKPRIVAVALIAATVAGCDKPASARSPGPGPSGRSRSSARGRRDRFADRAGSRQGPGQPRLSPRRTHDRAARQRGRCAQGGPGRRPARPTEPAERAAIGASQPRIGRGGADPGAPHFLAAAGALEGWLDVPGQIRRSPAGLDDRPGQVDSAQAQVRIAQNQLSYTVLFADAPGAVTAEGRRAGRSGPGRADDRAGRATGRTRRRL